MTAKERKIAEINKVMKEYEFVPFWRNEFKAFWNWCQRLWK